MDPSNYLAGSYPPLQSLGLSYNFFPARLRRCRILFVICIVFTIIVFFGSQTNLYRDDDTPCVLSDDDRHLPTPSVTGSARYFDETLTLDEIQNMVAGTRGFLARDYSLGLGWNNV